MSALLTLLVALSGAAVADDDDLNPRFSPSLGVGLMRPLSGRADISRESRPAATLDLTLELGSVFVGLGAHLSPDNVFIGPRLGYAIENPLVAPHGCVGIGFMSQTAESSQETRPGLSTTFEGSGLGFEFEAGVIPVGGVGIRLAL